MERDKALSRARTWFESAIASTPWVRVLLTALVGALGGSTVVTFVNRYAVYHFAVTFGCRLPAEGVPYLSVAVSLLSLAFFLIASASAVAAYVTWLLVAKLLIRVFGDKRQLAIRLLSSLVTGLTAVVIHILIRRPRVGVVYFVPVALFVAVVLVLVLISLRPRWLPAIATVLAFGLLVFTCANMFNAKGYASFLRHIRYGGGIPVSVSVTDQAEVAQEFEGYLLLVTETHFVLFRPSEAGYLEIPRHDVQELRYLVSRDFRLPAARGSLINLFEHLWTDPA